MQKLKKTIFNDWEFWQSALTWHQSVTTKVYGAVLLFVIYAFFITFYFDEWHKIDFPIGPFELSGGFLGLLLVFRINAGYDRWWEARKLWGGIVNQSRNLAVATHQYGSPQKGWQSKVSLLIVAFPHLARQHLRGETNLAELDFLTPDLYESIFKAQHKPLIAINLLAELMEEALQVGSLSSFAFLQIDKEKTQLIDHLGACERILKTPVPKVIDIKIRRFLLIFLLLLPFLLIQKVGWMCPFIMMLITYPLLALDQIGIELQNPFNILNLSHLPLNDICNNIQKNVFEVFQTRNRKVSEPLPLPEIEGLKEQSL